MFFASEQYDFRKVADICELENSQISSKALRPAKFSRSPVGRRGAEKLRGCS
jgi:hypothetical protein